MTGCLDVQPLQGPLGVKKLDCVLYKDAADARGAGLLILANDPELFTGELRDMLCARPYQALTVRPEYSLLGRAFSRNTEHSDEVVISAARDTLMNTRWPWAVWFPLRHSRKFAGLSNDEQNRLLDEFEATPEIEAGDAGEVRLQCHGLDASGNDMFVGLVGGDLGQLSTIIARRQQTEYVTGYIDSLGPFFVGQAIWQGRGSDPRSARW